MCWDISLATDVASVKKLFTNLKDERQQTDYDFSWLANVQAITFPEYPIIYKEKESKDLALREMEWGVLPAYIQDPKAQEDRRRNMINIRSERILTDSKSYWHRLRNQRCLIPVTGTYEHRKINGWKKKVPYHIAEKDRSLYFVPGLYQWHETVDADAVVQRHGSFGMLTREANDLMAKIHNDGPNKHRMPLYLPEELEQFWLQDISDEEIAQVIAFEMPSSMLEVHPVYTLRGHPERPDGKERYEAYNWEGLPELGQDSPLNPTLF